MTCNLTEIMSSRVTGLRRFLHFQVDSLLERKTKSALASNPNVENAAFLNLTLLGLYDRRFQAQAQTPGSVGVDVLLMKINHKKRKESVSAPETELKLNAPEVPVNPSEDHPPNKAPAVSIPAKSFKVLRNSATGNHQTVSFALSIRVHNNNSGSNSQQQQQQNSEENVEPGAAKRRKVLRNSSSGNGNNSLLVEGKILKAELVVYDKQAGYYYMII